MIASLHSDLLCSLVLSIDWLIDWLIHYAVLLDSLLDWLRWLDWWIHPSIHPSLFFYSVDWLIFVYFSRALFCRLIYWFSWIFSVCIDLSSTGNLERAPPPWLWKLGSQNVSLDVLSRVKIVSGRKNQIKTRSYDGFCFRSINQSITDAPHGCVNRPPIPGESVLDWLIDLSYSTVCSSIDCLIW